LNSQQAQQELQNFQATRKGAGDYYTQAQNELGVGGAQQRANDLRGLIRNTETALKGVDSSVRGRTQGSLVTSAQQQRLANLERQPLAEELGGHQGAYTDEMANYRDLLGQAGTRAGLSYQTDTDRATALQRTYENLFGQEREAEARRQWQAQFDESRRQADAMKKQTEALYSRIGASNTATAGIDWNKINSALNAGSDTNQYGGTGSLATNPKGIPTNMAGLNIVSTPQQQSGGAPDWLRAINNMIPDWARAFK
jgi:hypothetical protein